MGDSDFQEHGRASVVHCSWTSEGNLVVSGNPLRSSHLEIRRVDYAAESYPWHVALIGCGKSKNLSQSHFISSPQRRICLGYRVSASITVKTYNIQHIKDSKSTKIHYTLGLLCKSSSMCKKSYPTIILSYLTFLTLHPAYISIQLKVC